MFANISRHPSKMWPPEQLEAAELISPDGIIDVAFPLVPPEADEIEVLDTATKIAGSIGSGVTAAMVQGEYTLTMFLASLLAKQDVDVYVACLGPQWTDGEGRRHRPFVRFRKIAGGNSNGEHSTIDKSGSI